MKTNYLKNIFLVGSGIAIATSTAIFASAPQGLSIQANLVNLTQYLKSLTITSNGTPNGNHFLNIDGQQGTILVQSGNYAFDFNSHQLFPGDYVGGLYQDNTTLIGNGIMNTGLPMAGLFGSDANGGQMGVTVRNDPNEGAMAMMEYESTGNQDEAVQVQHQLKVKADGTTMSFDDYNVLGLQTQLGLGGYGFYVDASSGGHMGLTREGVFSLKNYIFPLENGSDGQVLTSHSNGQLSWEDAGSSSDILSTGVFISSEKILDIGTNPVELVASPGEGKFIQPIAVSMKYNTSSTPYEFAGHLVVFEGGSPSDYLYGFTADLGATEGFLVNGGYNIASIAKLAEDEALKISSIENSNPTQGDGFLEIFVSYKIVNTAIIP